MKEEDDKFGFERARYKKITSNFYCALRRLQSMLSTSIFRFFFGPFHKILSVLLCLELLYTQSQGGRQKALRIHTNNLGLLGNRQEQLEFWRELLLRVEAVGEVQAADAAIGVQ